MDESFLVKKDEFIIKLAEEIINFLAKNLTRSLSTFAELKIFISAYMHIMNSFAVYISPNSLLDNEPEEILDLWGLAFCKISNFKELFRQDINVLKGMSEKQKQEIESLIDQRYFCAAFRVLLQRHFLVKPSNRTKPV